MNLDCREFRTRLAALLDRAPDPARLTELSWQQHLLGCDACRALLVEEEALEALLASLPEPQLPPELAARVIARLRDRSERRGQTLDDLLALDDVGVPPGLADRVRAVVREGRAAEPLERLLELPPAPEVPAGLAARVLAALQTERVPLGPVPSLERVGAGRRVLLRAAALLVVSLALAGAWRFSRQATDGSGSGGSAGGGSVAGGSTIGGPGGFSFDDEDVIANLPLLEYWDMLEELEPLEQDLITQLDLSDEALLDTEDS
ncbi:MAG: hypothetical protein V3T22_12285 [Planctomycetota bacterium]